MSEEEKPILVIDFRESFLKAQEFEKMGYQVINGNLGEGNTENYPECADYYYKCEHGELLIERKTMRDFDGSLVNGHLFDTAQKMREWMMGSENGTRYGFIKVVGDTSEFNPYAKVSVKGRVGGMESIQARYGIPVNCYSYYAGDDFPKEFALNWSIHKLIRSLSENKFGEFRKQDLFKYRNPHNKRDFVDSRDFYIHCFRGIQGVSETIATRIVDTLGIESFEDLSISLNYASLKAVPKIGPKIANRILEHWSVIL